MYCVKCGSENDDNANFCYKCGNKLENRANIKKSGLNSRKNTSRSLADRNKDNDVNKEDLDVISVEEFRQMKSSHRQSDSGISDSGDSKTDSLRQDSNENLNLEELRLKIDNLTDLLSRLHEENIELEKELKKCRKEREGAEDLYDEEKDSSDDLFKRMKKW